MAIHPAIGAVLAVLIFVVVEHGDAIASRFVSTSEETQALLAIAEEGNDGASDPE